METDLLAIEKNGDEVVEERLSRVFRAAHSIEGGSSYFDLPKIGELAHQMEVVVEAIRSRTMVPGREMVRVLLDATDRLHELIEDPGASNQADITETKIALARLCEDQAAGKCDVSASVQAAVAPAGEQAAKRLRVLLVEDDFTSRLVLQIFLSRYGECHVAANGKEAVEAFRSALERGQSYELICMDIMMPEMDGREAVRQVRAMEEARGVLSTHGAKIIMTTAVDDVKDVARCFNDLCDGYLIKPIDLAQLLSQMKSYRLVD
jgi:two-component system chemotaxis response regulator CheY